MHYWEELGTTLGSANGWSGPKNQQNKMDKFLSVYGVIYAIVNSCKNKCKTLEQLILKEVLPRGFNTKIEKIQFQRPNCREIKYKSFSMRM